MNNFIEGNRFSFFDSRGVQAVFRYQMPDMPEVR